VPAAPKDMDERVRAICASVRRLAAFDPAVIVIAPGAPGDPASPAGPVDEVLPTAGTSSKPTASASYDGSTPAPATTCKDAP